MLAFGATCIHMATQKCYWGEKKLVKINIKNKGREDIEDKWFCLHTDFYKALVSCVLRLFTGASQNLLGKFGLQRYTRIH